MEEVLAWALAEGRLPDGRSGDRGERFMAHWLSARRRETAEGALDPPYRDGLDKLTGWPENRRKAEDEARWHERLAELVDFRLEGNDWPRHHAYDSDREHSLGVQVHPHRYKCLRGELDPLKVRVLNDAAPG
jgi:hypothetical protein